MSEEELTTLGQVKKALRAGNKWLAADDLEEEEVVTIERVVKHFDEEFQDGKRNVVAIHFAEEMKPLVLNQINTSTIIEAHGNEVSAWRGKTITVYAARLASKAFGRSYGVRIK